MAAQKITVNQAPTITSDRSLKRDIASIDDGLSLISALRPVSYVRKADASNTTEFGLIAQDVQTVAPNVVSTVDAKKGLLGVAYTQLIAPLIRAVQQLVDRLTATETSIAALQATVTAQQATIAQQQHALQQLTNRLADDEAKMTAILGARSGP